MILTKYIRIKQKRRQRHVNIICINSSPALFFTPWLYVNYSYSKCNTNNSLELILLDQRLRPLWKTKQLQKTTIYTYKEEQTFTSIAVYAFQSQKKDSDQTVVTSCAKKNLKYKNGSTRYQSAYTAGKRNHGSWNMALLAISKPNRMPLKWLNLFVY